LCSVNSKRRLNSSINSRLSSRINNSLRVNLVLLNKFSIKALLSNTLSNMAVRELIRSHRWLLVESPKAINLRNSTLLNKGSSRTRHPQRLCLLKVADGPPLSSEDKRTQISSKCSIICRLRHQSLLKVVVGRLRLPRLNNSSSISSRSNNISNRRNKAKVKELDVDEGVEDQDIRVRVIRYCMTGVSLYLERKQPRHGIHWRLYFIH
jgi:hypothetical protein